MKANYIILAAFLLVISACSSAYRSTSAYDDVYFDESESYLEEIDQNENYTPVRENGQAMTNKYESDEAYGEPDAEAHLEDYNEETGEGNTYITNNYYGDYYDEPYDYYYSSRIRRFSRPYVGFSYFDGCYTDYRWYDPYYTGVSIYVGWSSPSWYGYYPYYRYQRYNPWCYDPWYNPYAGSYYSGFNHGYWTGFHDGYYAGSYNNWYGYGNNYNSGYYGNNESYTPTDYYYGPRYANNTGSNSGMHGQRSGVEYGKNGTSGNGGQRGTVNGESLGSQQVNRNGNQPGTALNGTASSGTKEVRKDYFEKKEASGQNVGGSDALNKGINNGIRTVRADKPETAGNGTPGSSISAGNGLVDQKNKRESVVRKEKTAPRTRQYEWDRYRGRQQETTKKSRGENLHNANNGIIRYRENTQGGENRNTGRGSIFKREERTRSPQDNSYNYSPPERRTTPSSPERKEIRRNYSTPKSNSYSSRKRKSEPARSEPRRTIKNESPTPRSSSSPNYNPGSNSGSRSHSSSPSYSSPSRSSGTSGSRNNSSQRLRTPR